MIWGVFGGLAVLMFFSGFLVWLAFRNGRVTEKSSKESEINEAVRRALLVRDRLQRDPDYARRVRERFTR